MLSLLISTTVKNRRILLEHGFTAHMPLPMQLAHSDQYRWLEILQSHHLLCMARF